MRKLLVISGILAGTVGVVACGTSGASNSGNSGNVAGSATNAQKTVTLYFASYSVTQDVYEKELFPAFETYWKDKTGQSVHFQASFDASGAEATAVVNGYPADVVALSLETDIDKIQQAGLITHNWQDTPTDGMVTDSIVAIGVRKGNPKHIQTWSDLAKPGVVVDLPNPATSGGAKWDINAIYYSALQHGNANEAKSLLTSIVKNVKVLDKSGEASMTTFTSGTGDAVVSYENEILEASNNLQTFSEVVPGSTMLIQNPIAVVDKNAQKHGDMQAAQGFVNWLESPTAQKIFESEGFRPVIKGLQGNTSEKFGTPKNLITVKNVGGWQKINQLLYSDNGIWNQVLESK